MTADIDWSGRAWDIPVLSIPTNWTALEVAAVVKCLDEDGDVRLLTRTSRGLSSWETVGMFTTANAISLAGLADEFDPDPDVPPDDNGH